MHGASVHGRSANIFKLPRLPIGANNLVDSARKRNEPDAAKACARRACTPEKSDVHDLVTGENCQCSESTSCEANVKAQTESAVHGHKKGGDTKNGMGRRIQFSCKRKLGSTVAASTSLAQAAQARPEDATNASKFRRAFKVPRR
jgi:hypothetical protein